ncbi:MAG: MFS transporter [Bacillota bacterium]
MIESSTTSIWTRNFILLCLANFSFFISLQQLIPTLPMYLIDIGGNQSDVGYVMGAYTIGAMLMRPIAGWLVDSYGRKKLMITGLILVIAITFFYRIADNVALTAVIRLMHGLCYGLVGTAFGTMVADSLPPSRLGEGMGFFGLTASVSMAMAPMIGFWLLGKYGYHTLFLTVNLLTLLSFFWSLPVQEVNINRTPQRSFVGMKSRMFEKSALTATGVGFFLCAVYGTILSFIALFGVERGIVNMGFFFTAMSIFMILSRPISGRWSDRGGTDRVLLIGHLAVLAGVIIIAVSHSVHGFMTAGMITGVGFGFCFPTLQALAVRNVPAERRGAATGTYFVGVDLGIGLGTIISGFVAKVTGYQLMYLANLIPLALAAMVYYQFANKSKGVSKRQRMV